MGKTIGLVTIPVVGGSVTVSTEGRLAFDDDDKDVCIVCSLDEVTAIQLAEALMTFVACELKRKNQRDPLSVAEEHVIAEFAEAATRKLKGT